MMTLSSKSIANFDSIFVWHFKHSSSSMQNVHIKWLHGFAQKLIFSISHAQHFCTVCLIFNAFDFRAFELTVGGHKWHVIFNVLVIFFLISHFFERFLCYVGDDLWKLLRCVTSCCQFFLSFTNELIGSFRQFSPVPSC